MLIVVSLFKLVFENVQTNQNSLSIPEARPIGTTARFAPFWELVSIWDSMRTFHQPCALYEYNPCDFRTWRATIKYRTGFDPKCLSCWWSDFGASTRLLCYRLTHMAPLRHPGKQGSIATLFSEEFPFKDQQYPIRGSHFNCRVYSYGTISFLYISISSGPEENLETHGGDKRSEIGMNAIFLQDCCYVPGHMALRLQYFGKYLFI
jgi:hypothetical protein